MHEAYEHVTSLDISTIFPFDVPSVEVDIFLHVGPYGIEKKFIYFTNKTKLNRYLTLFTINSSKSRLTLTKTSTAIIYTNSAILTIEFTCEPAKFNAR